MARLVLQVLEPDGEVSLAFFVEVSQSGDAGTCKAKQNIDDDVDVNPEFSPVQSIHLMLSDTYKALISAPESRTRTESATRWRTSTTLKKSELDYGPDR